MCRKGVMGHGRGEARGVGCGMGVDEDHLYFHSRAFILDRPWSISNWLAGSVLQATPSSFMDVLLNDVNTSYTRLLSALRLHVTSNTERVI